MIELRLLGPLVLRNAEGVDIHSVLAQPKRLALLAYLAVERGGGFHRRDTLLALFWPESDSDRARAALRRALYFLRQSLGAEVLVSRGDEDVGIGAGTLRCDAAEFARLQDAGAEAAALELYRGDLLDGFFITDAPGFEAWLEAERASLRGHAVRAGWTLAARAEAAGDIEGALRFAERAATLSGDEPAARRYMALLVRAGDSAGALRVYGALADRLAREYALEPAPETSALADEARAVRGAPIPPGDAPVRDVPAPQRPSAPAGAALPAPAAAVAPPAPSPPTAHGGSTRRRPTRALRWAATLTLLAVAGVTSALLMGRERPTATGARPLPDVIAVLPFTYYGSGQSAYLQEGIARLLSTNLNGAGRVRSVDPRALLAALGPDDTAPADPVQARAIAERLGAGVVVQGHIIEAGAALRITALLSGPGNERSEVTIEGESDRLFDLIDELTIKLLAVHGPGPAARLTRLAAVTTHSLPALRAYLEGEALSRQGRWGDALESFQRAVAADSMFGLAHFRVSTAAHWTNDPAQALAARNRARELGGLPRRESQLVEAWTLHTHGNPLAAERLYRSIVSEFPDDVESWLQLGEVLFHWGPTVGRPMTEARAPFERVLAFEPGNAAALIHLARLAAFERDSARLTALVDRLQALDPASDQALELDALRALTRGDRAGSDAPLRRLADADESRLLRAATTMAVFANADAAMMLAEALTTPDRPPVWHARGGALLSHLEMARGRRAAAGRHMIGRGRVSELVPAGAEHAAIFAVLPFLPVPRGELERIRAAVAAMPTQPPAGAAPGEAQWIHPTQQHFLLGLLSLRLGDAVAALGHAVQLEALPGGSVSPATNGRLARIVRAEVARTGGQAQDALRLLGESGVWPDAGFPRIGNHAKSYERFLRAELLRELGRDADALLWYDTFPDSHGDDLPYLALTHLRRAEILQRSGRRADAAAHYTRALELWRDAEPELEPLIERARAALASLQGQ